ncbi:MAG: hypothetical protein AB7I18_05210 [Candidatus Berkiella sp.]
MKTSVIQKKSVSFDLDKNTIHVCTVLYPKGSLKPPPADTKEKPSIPVDLEEKGIIKNYLENEDDKYKGFILVQYRNYQDGNYTLDFIDPNTKERFAQTFNQEQIDAMLEASKAKPKI